MTEVKLVKNIGDKDFKEETANGITLVDFWAPWCMPCRFQGPILEKLAPEVKGKAKIRKLNVEENQETPYQFGVSGIPTLILFKDGKVEKQFIGLQTKDVLLDAITQLS